MDFNVKFLDCTLRDGAYVCDGNFGISTIKGLICKLQTAGVDIIECGWLKNNMHSKGSSFFHVPNDLLNYVDNKTKNVTFVAMIDWDRYDLDYLPQNDGKSIDAIRVVFPYGKYIQGIAVGNKIENKGYRVYYQAANTMAYSDEDLIALAEEVNKTNAVALSVVDTFGAMYEEDLDRIVTVLHNNLRQDISLGFHSHNNQQLSYALTMHFVKLLKKLSRRAIVDASLCGMGRGAGNATTELVINYLNTRCGKHYDMDSIMDAIDVYMSYFQENYQWGYSTPYFIAGVYQCHVNNIAYLLNNHRASAKDMRNIIASLSTTDRRKYDYDLLEQKYLNNQNLYVDDEKSKIQLRNDLKNKTIVLIAPGKSSLIEKELVDNYIKQNKSVVIGVNAILSGYNYDYVIFANQARYEYAREAYPEEFAKVKKILLTSISKELYENDIIIGFNNVIKRGWIHFDNAVICTLRLMDLLELKEVAIAGFDGFKTKYNESYADKYLPTLNPNNKWDDLNTEIKEMFDDYIERAEHCKKVVFITSSIFE